MSDTDDTEVSGQESGGRTLRRHFLLCTAEIPCVSTKKARDLFIGCHPDDWLGLGRLMMAGSRRKVSGSAKGQKGVVNQALKQTTSGNLENLLAMVADIIGLGFPLAEGPEARFGINGRKLTSAMMGAVILCLPTDQKEKYGRAVNELRLKVERWRGRPEVQFMRSKFAVNISTEETEIAKWQATGQLRKCEERHLCPICRVTATNLFYELKHTPTGETVWGGAECAAQVGWPEGTDDISRGLKNSFRIRKSSYYPLEENTLLEIEDPWLREIWIQYLAIRAEKAEARKLKNGILA